ncbi:hypothetical protein ADUPG1_011086 [Aduncisulcus paluster]|uniref:Uncharacterized protein n=1 Tax=Aduncisulcus paluster TaxID=2918883 RepID=A0ABQ5JYN5_9EUKA|nr:hypothetical protein ADUPG1_011086 [Aduncisulcus paluster]
MVNFHILGQRGVYYKDHTILFPPNLNYDLFPLICGPQKNIITSYEEDWFESDVSESQYLQLVGFLNCCIRTFHSYHSQKLRSNIFKLNGTDDRSCQECMNKMKYCSSQGFIIFSIILGIFLASCGALFMFVIDLGESLSFLPLILLSVGALFLLFGLLGLCIGKDALKYYSANPVYFLNYLQLCCAYINESQLIKKGMYLLVDPSCFSQVKPFSAPSFELYFAILRIDILQSIGNLPVSFRNSLQMAGLSPILQSSSDDPSSANPVYFLNYLQLCCTYINESQLIKKGMYLLVDPSCFSQVKPFSAPSFELYFAILRIDILQSIGNLPVSFRNSLQMAGLSPILQSSSDDPSSSPMLPLLTGSVPLLSMAKDSAAHVYRVTSLRADPFTVCDMPESIIANMQRAHLLSKINQILSGRAKGNAVSKKKQKKSSPAEAGIFGEMKKGRHGLQVDSMERDLEGGL